MASAATHLNGNRECHRERQKLVVNEDVGTPRRIAAVIVMTIKVRGGNNTSQVRLVASVAMAPVGIRHGSAFLKEIKDCVGNVCEETLLPKQLALTT